jgi:hypothetical protein
MRKLLVLLAFFVSFVAFSNPVTTYAQTSVLEADQPVATDEVEEATESAEVVVTPTPIIRPDLTQKTEETIEPLEKLLSGQELGPVWPTNPIKYAIRASVAAGVPANTIVLLLLLPAVAAIIAATRHLVGLRGFGIFLPAALSVVFVATGPVVGIGLFLIIVTVSTAARLILRRSKIKLQYLPRMALILLFVVMGVLGVLFAAPLIRRADIASVSIFPVLILALLAEDFSRVQIGKSAKTAINLTTETLILALVSYVFLTLESVQEFALLNPEILLLSVFVFDFMVGKYVGLRFIELWRFRKLISG